MKVLTLRPTSTVASQGNWNVVNSADHADAVDDVTYFSVATYPDLSGNTYYGQAQDLYQFFTTSTTLQQPNVGNRSSNVSGVGNPNDGTSIYFTISNSVFNGSTATFTYTNPVGQTIDQYAYVNITFPSTPTSYTAYNLTNALVASASSGTTNTFTVNSTLSATTISVTATAAQPYALTGGDFFLYVNDITRFRSGQIVAILEGLQEGQTPYSPNATSTDAYYSEWLDFTATGLIPNVPYKQSVDPIDFPTSSLMIPQGYQNISTVMSPNVQFYKPPANKYMGQFLSAAQSTAYVLGQAPTPYAVGTGSASPWYVATSGDNQALSNLASILPDATAQYYQSGTTPPTVLSISIGYFSTAINVSSTANLAVGQTITVATKPQTTLTPASMGWNAGKIISISNGWIVTDLRTQTQRQTVIAGSGNTTPLTLNPSTFVMQLPNAGFSGVVTNGNTVIQGVSATQGIQAGMVIVDSTNPSNISSTTYVASVNTTSGQITMSNAAAGTSSEPDSVSYSASLGGGNYIATTNTTLGLNQAVGNTPSGFTNALVTTFFSGTGCIVNQISATLLSGATFSNSATYSVASNPQIAIVTALNDGGTVASLPYLNPPPTGWTHLTGTGLTSPAYIIGADPTGYGSSLQRIQVNQNPSSYTASASWTSTVNFNITCSVAYTALQTATITVNTVTIGSTAYTVNSSGTFTVGATAYNISNLIKVNAPVIAGTVVPAGRNVSAVVSNTLQLSVGSTTTTGTSAANSTITITVSTGRTIEVTKAGTSQDNILVSGATVSCTYLPAGTTFSSSTQLNSGPYEMLISQPSNTINSWSTTSAIVSGGFIGTIYSNTLTGVSASSPLASGDSILVYSGATLLGNTSIASVSGSTATLSAALTSGGYQTFGTSVTGSASFDVDELYAVGSALAFNNGGATASWSSNATTISLSSTAGVYTGMEVQGSGVPFGAQVSNISGTTVALGYPSLVTGDNYNQAGGTVGNWQAGTNSTLSVALGTGFNTSNSLLLTRINTTVGYGDAYLPMSSITNFKVQPNQTYVVGIDILANSTAYGKVYQLDVRDQNNSRLNTLQMTMNTSAGVWQFFEMSFTPPVGTTTLGIFISDDPQSSPVSGAAVNINNIFLVLAATTSNTQISNGYAPAITTGTGTSGSTPLSITSAQYNFATANGYQSSYTTDGFLVTGSNSYYTGDQADGSFLSGMAIQGNGLPAGTVVSQAFLQDEFVSGKPITINATTGSTAYTLNVSSVVTSNGFTSTVLQNLCVGQVVSGTGISPNSVITGVDTVNKYITLSQAPDPSVSSFVLTTQLFTAQTFALTATYTVSGSTYYFTPSSNQLAGFMLGMIVTSTYWGSTAIIINISGGNIYLSNDINDGNGNSSSFQVSVTNGFVSLSNASAINTTQPDTYTVSYNIPQANTGIFGATIDSTTTRLNTDSGNKFDETFFTAPYLSIDPFNNPNHGQFLIMPVNPSSIKSNPVANALTVASHSPNASTTVEGVGVYANVTQSVVFQGTYNPSGVAISVGSQSGAFPSSPTGWTLWGPRSTTAGSHGAFFPYTVDQIVALGTTFTASATSTSSTTLTSVTNISSLCVGAIVVAAGIPANTFISSINVSASTLTLSANPTSTFSGETISIPATTLHVTTNLPTPANSPAQMVFSAPVQVGDINGLSAGQYISGDIIPYSSTYGGLSGGRGVSGPFVYGINQAAQTTAYLGDVAYGTSTILNISSTANTAAGLSGTNGLLVGQQVSYTGFPTGTVIISVDSATQVTVSNTATATVLQDTIDFEYYNITLCEWVNPGSVTGGTPYTGYSGMYPISGTQSNSLVVAGTLAAGVSNVPASQSGGNTYTLYFDTVANLEPSPSYSWTGNANGGYSGITGVSASATPYINVGDAVAIPSQSQQSFSYSTTQLGYNICFVSAIVAAGSNYNVYLIDNQSNPVVLPIGVNGATFTNYTPNYVFYQSRLVVLEVDSYSNSAIVWAVDSENFLAGAFTSYPNGDSQTAILPVENTVTIYSAYTSPALDATGIGNAGVVMMSNNTSFNHAAGTLVGSYDVGDRYFGTDTVGDQEVLTPTTIGSLFGTTAYATATTNQNYIVVSPLNNTSTLINGVYYDQYGNIASQGISPTTGTTITNVSTVAGNYYMTLPSIASPNISVGWSVRGNGIPTGTVVTFIDGGSIYLSNPISVSATSASYIFTPQVWGVMVVGEGDTQETVVFNGTYNFMSGSATGNTISPISIVLAAGQKFQHNHFAGEPVVVPNIYTLDGFQNQHAAGAMISAGAENPITSQGQQNLLADNTSGAQANSFDTTISLSPNWLTSGDNDNPSLATTLAAPASVSATTLTISSNDLFPTSGYNNVINNGIFSPPEIGRVAGLISSGTNIVPFLPNGSSVPTSSLFFVQIGYDVVQVVNVAVDATGTISPTTYYLNLSATTSANYVDGTPITLKMLDTTTTYNSLTVPHSYLNRSFSGSASVGSNVISSIYASSATQPVSAVSSGVSYTTTAGATTFNLASSAGQPYVGMSVYGDTVIQPNTIVTAVSGSSGAWVVSLSKPLTGAIASTSTVWFAYAVSGTNIPPLAYINSASGTFTSGSGSVTLVYASGQPAYPTVTSTPQVTLNTDASLYASGQYVSTLYISPAPCYLPSGSTMYLKYGLYTQIITTAAAINAGDTSVSVSPFIPVFNYTAASVTSGAITNFLNGTNVAASISYGLINELSTDQTIVLGSGTTPQELVVTQPEPFFADTISVQPFIPLYNYDNTMIASGLFTVTTTVANNVINLATYTFNGYLTTGSNVISSVSSIAGLYTGEGLSGTGIPLNSYIVSMTASASGTFITMSQNASATTANGTINAAPQVGQRLVGTSVTGMFTANITSASATMTGLSTTANLVVGTQVSGAGLPYDAVIVSISGSSATLNLNASASATGVTVSFTTTPFPNPVFVSSVSGSAVTLTSPAAATFSGTSLQVNPTTLTAPIELVVGNDTLSEIVYPYTIPVRQANGTYQMQIASPLNNPYDAGIDVSYYAQPTAVAGDVRWKPDTQTIQKYDGTKWSDAEVSSVQVSVALQGSEMGGDKHSFALTDLTTGDVAPADTYQNAVNPASSS